MDTPFNMSPKDLPDYYQQVYEELMEGIKDSEITVMPCLNKKRGFVVYMIVRIKLLDEESESGEVDHTLAITPLAVVTPPNLLSDITPIFSKNDDFTYVPHEDNNIDPDDNMWGWTPPTKGTLTFFEEQ